jgi:hypothetical protein
MAERRYLLALSATIANADFAGDFSHMVIFKLDSPPLEANPPLFHNLGSGRRPEKVYCTELLHTLYVNEKQQRTQNRALRDAKEDMK